MLWVVEVTQNRRPGGGCVRLAIKLALFIAEQGHALITATLTPLKGLCDVAVNV